MTLKYTCKEKAVVELKKENIKAELNNVVIENNVDLVNRIGNITGKNNLADLSININNDLIT